MDPYAIEPEHIPVTDSYADIPLFGLYCPKPGDFSVKLEHVTCQSSAAMQYWESVVSLCDATRLYPADESGPDVFALGNIIVKSHHLHYTGEIDYSFADSNEVEAISIAKDVLGDIKVPEIYFAGKIRGRQVLIQERLPGVALCVAWPYLVQVQRSFKVQARAILRQLHGIKPHDGRRVRSHVVQDPNILRNGRLNPLEGEYHFFRHQYRSGLKLYA